MGYASIDLLRSQLGGPVAKQRDPAYVAKMLHKVPETKVIERNPFILDKVRGKNVLDFGASGKLHTQILEEAAWVVGVDLEDAPGVIGFDLDDVSRIDLPLERMWKGERWYDPDIIVCGEILEHLSNPGYFLKRLRAKYPNTPVIITVPNAASKVGMTHLEKGVENVNIDHVSWYSWRTLTTLLSRFNYQVAEFYWYNGSPRFAEGLIVVTE